MKISSLWLVAALLLFASIGNAQSYTPTYSTKLEFKNGTFKLLISPSAVNANDTLTLPASSSPGALVNDGTGLLSWTPMTSPSWHLLGNSGTNPDSNFIGTIDSVSVIHKTNNIEQLRVRASGGVSLPPTEASGRGIVYVDSVRFLHSYGSNNTFVGPHAGNLVLTGNSNTGLGGRSLINLGTGDSNTAVGHSALDRINNDFRNTAVGVGALSTLQSGNNNTAVGVNTGIGDTTGSNNTMIGAYATIGDLRDNATAIGYRAFADLDNTVVLGSINGVNGATDDTYIGIGTVQPGEKFEMANGNMILSNTNNISPMFCIQEPSDSGFAVVSLLAPSLPNGNVFLYLPPTEGEAFSVLSSDGTGVTSWMNSSDLALVGTLVRRDSATGGFTAGRIVISDQSGIRFNDADNSAYTEIIPQAAITTSYTLTLPPDDGTANQFMQTDGSGGLSFATIDIATDISGVLPIANGGTNSGAALNNDRIMVSSAGAIVEAAALTDGQLLIGSTGAAPVAAAITGTPNQVIVANGAGSITLSTPQNIAAASTPTFGGMTLNGDLDMTGDDINNVNTISSGGETVIVNDSLQVTGNVVPTTTLLYSLGTDDLRWTEAYVGGTSVHIGPTGGENAGTELSIGYAANSGSINVNGGITEVAVTAGTTTLNTDLDMTSGNILNVTEISNGSAGLSIDEDVDFNNHNLSNVGNITMNFGTNISNPSVGGIVRVADDFEVTGNATIIGTTTINTGLGVVHSDAGGLLSSSLIVTADITDDNVTLGKIANAGANDVLVGSGNAGSGANYTEITLGGNLSMSTTTLNVVANPTFTGMTLTGALNMSGSVIGNVATIDNGASGVTIDDDLTVNGAVDITSGTIDGTSIGATTPSTGAFTTITGTALPSASTSTDIVTSNAGALETRTIASLGGSVAVSTDASLTGDGTTGSPLGLNLANANTWTATQTLPTTAAQGDALIASVNAGTTTIDAARIGAGLTDAQINDNLTINGGSVDASPVGATTESTGRFTTVEATTVLGAATTPGAGTYYRDNAIIAWGDIAAAGVVNDQFGNFVIAHTPGTGVYTATLPNAPTAAATTATVQSLGVLTVTRAGAVLTITTYDLTGTPTDLDFYFITTGRP